MYFSNSIERVIEALPTNKRLDFEKKNEIRSGLHTYENAGLLTPDVAQAVIDIGNNFSLLTAERFMESSARYCTDEGFDFKKYNELFVRAHRRFGKLTGGYFAMSYGRMLRAGVLPDDYYELVDQAVDRRGKKFGGWFAYAVPTAVEVGGNPREYLSCSGALHIKGGLPLARPFMLEGPYMLKDEGVGFSRIYEVASEGVDSVGVKATGLMLHNMLAASRLGYPLEAFLSDAQRMQQISGRDSGTAASWYLSAYNGMYKTKEKLKSEVKFNLDMHRVLGNYNGMDFKSHAAEWQQKDEMFNPGEFKEHYEALLREIGQNPATFLSKVVRIGAGWHYAAWGIVSIRNLAESVFDLRARVRPKVFHSAMYFIPKMISVPESAVYLIEDVLYQLQEKDEKQILEALAFTRGVARRAGGVSDLWFPTGKSEGQIEDWDEWFDREREMDENAFYFMDEERFDSYRTEDFFIGE